MVQRNNSSQTQEEIDRDSGIPGLLPSLASRISWILVLMSLASCRKQARKEPPRRPGDLQLIHPMARNVKTSTLQGKHVLEMDVPVPVRRALAYYEQGLAKSWHLLERQSDSQGTHIQVRRGRQLLDIYASSHRSGTHLRIVTRVEEAAPAATIPRSPGRRPPGPSTDRAGQAERDRSMHRLSRASHPVPDAGKPSVLPHDIRLPKGWAAGPSSTYINKSQKLSDLARQLRRALESQGWTVMPSPDQQTADRPNVLDLIASKGRRVLYLHMKGTADGTLLTWMKAAL